MKSTSKFLAVMLAITGLFCCAVAVGIGAGFILSSTLLLMGFITFIIGFMADILAKNRMILEDIQYHVRKIDYEGKENIGLSIQEAYGRDEYKKH